MGAGWSVAGWQHLYPQADGGVVISDGGGSLSYFAPSGTSGSYVSPAGDFSTLSYNSSTGKYYRYYPGGHFIHFGADGRLTDAGDRFSNTTTYSYDGSGRPYQITDPASQVTTLFYNAAGKLDSIVTPGGRTTRFSVNASGDLVSITDPANVQALAITYDSNHRATGRTDRRGGHWGFSYDFASKLAADTMPSVAVRGVSAKPVMKYQSLESATLNSGTGTHARVIASSVRAHVTNPNGQTTDLALNRFGAATGVTEPLGRVSSMTMDDSARVRSSTGPSGHYVEYSWSGPDLTQVHDVTGGSSVDMTYEPTYHEVTLVSGDGAPEVYYDWTSGKLQRVRMGTDTTKFTYDSRGRVATATDPAGHVTTYHYATSGLQNTDSVSAPGPRSWIFLHDHVGRDSVEIAPNGIDSRYSHYDLVNRVIRTIARSDVERDTTIYTYDSLYLRSVKDAKGQLYQFSPNALGWVESRTDPTGHAESFQYDSSGNLTKATNRRAQQITFAYDALGQLTSRVAGGLTTHFAADPDGAFAAAWNSESADTTWFDDADRADSMVTWRAGRRYKMTPSWSAGGVRTQLSLSAPVIGARTLRYHYNAKFQLDTLTALDGLKTTFGYNADGLPMGVHIPSGLDVTRTFISTHGQGSVAYSGGASNLNAELGLHFGYDENGRVNQKYNFAQDTMWFYGFMHGRLVNAELRELVAPSCSPGQKYGDVCTYGSYNSITSEGWSWDKMGNPTSGVATGNRLVAYQGDSLAYDLDGNLTRKYSPTSDEHFYWNSLGQLDSVVADTITVRFGYDALGRRVRKQGSRGTTYMIYDGDDLLLTTDASGNSLEEYTYYPGIDRPHSIRKGGVTYYYATDFTGNVTGLVRTDGTIANQYDYHPFGERRSAMEAVYNPLQYSARELDTETGLYYYRARYYDPELERFISEDPAGLSGGMNLYAYVGNDPVNGRDPLGLGPSCNADDLGDRGGHWVWTDAQGAIWRLGTVRSCANWFAYEIWDMQIPWGMRSSGVETFYLPPVSRGASWLHGQTGEDETRSQFTQAEIKEVFSQLAGYRVTREQFAACVKRDVPLPGILSGATAAWTEGKSIASGVPLTLTGAKPKYTILPAAETTSTGVALVASTVASFVTSMATCGLLSQTVNELATNSF
jgi:RHS repeat-associated protein